MNNFINYNSISIGYNNTGQEFFDIIDKYRMYIHSYFLSFNESMMCVPYNMDDIVYTLKKCNTYDIPANILFNTYNDDHCEMIINTAKTVINVKAVTVLKLSTARKIKEKFPDLEIHLSVRYFDWNNKSIEELVEDLFINDRYKFIDVINISGSKSFTDHNLMKSIQRYGIKIKLIMNESCIINRSVNFNDFNRFENCKCANAECHKFCNNVVSDYKWMELSRINMVKEMLQYYNIDILKLSTRDVPDNRYIDDLLEYWTSSYNTKSIYPPYGNIDISDKYDLFLEWCKIKSNCSGFCKDCKKCKEYYDKFIS